MSSTVSCSSAAHRVSVSSRMPAQILATPTGCTMKSSPERRRWSAWCTHAYTNASSTRSRSIDAADSCACSSTIANRSESSRRSASVSSERSTSRVGLGMRDPIDRRPRGGEHARTRCRPRPPARPFRPSAGPGSASWKMICAAQESSSVLVPLCIHPVRRRALERSRRSTRDRQGRQFRVEADELELREDLDQPSRQACRAAVRTVSAKQVLELLAGHPPPQPQAPVEGHERSTETVLQLVHLLCKA